jgi:hypothetical protein
MNEISHCLFIHFLSFILVLIYYLLLNVSVHCVQQPSHDYSEKLYYFICIIFTLNLLLVLAM